MNQRTISQRLHDDLSLLIDSTTPGGRLASEPELARSLGVSRATLREAMRTFEIEGRIRRKQGSGTFVSHPSNVITSGLEVLESIETLATRIGLTVMMGECNIEKRPGTSEEVEALGLGPEAIVLSVDRVIIAEEHPVAYLVDIIPADVIPQITLDNFTGSILDLLLRQAEPGLDFSHTEINAVTASHDIARLMGIQRGDVLLRFSAFLYTTTGNVVDYSLSYFLPGYFRFHVNRRVGRGK